MDGIRTSVKPRKALPRCAKFEERQQGIHPPCKIDLADYTGPTTVRIFPKPARAEAFQPPPRAIAGKPVDRAARLTAFGRTRKKSPWFCLVCCCGTAVVRVHDVTGSCVSVAAAQEIRKLTLSQICRPTPANQPIAVVAGPEPERPLRPKFGRSPSTLSTSVHRRLRRRGLPSQQSAVVTKQPFTGRHLSHRSGSCFAG